MRRILLGKRAQKYLDKLPAKHARQLLLKVRLLQESPEQPDTKKLQNSNFYRVDVGEHRIAYAWTSQVLHVPIIGKRNDGEVYRILDRFER